MAKSRFKDGRFLSVAVVAVAVGAAGVTFMFKLYEFVAASTTGILPGIVTATVLSALACSPASKRRSRRSPDQSVEPSFTHRARIVRRLGAT